MAIANYENVRNLAQQLRPEEQAKLIADLSLGLARQIEAEIGPPEPLYGSLAHLGPAPSAEEFDEARREMWANFAQDEG
jgi:hypothetical protein